MSLKKEMFEKFPKKKFWKIFLKIKFPYFKFLWNTKKCFLLVDTIFIIRCSPTHVVCFNINFLCFHYLKFKSVIVSYFRDHKGYKPFQFLLLLYTQTHRFLLLKYFVLYVKVIRIILPYWILHIHTHAEINKQCPLHLH